MPKSPLLEPFCKKFLVLQDQVQGFSETIEFIMNSKAWEKLTSKYGDNITLEELSSLAQIVSAKLEIDLENEHLENLPELINWYDVNYEKVFDFIDKHVVIYDDNNNIIDDTK